MMSIYLPNSVLAAPYKSVALGFSLLLGMALTPISIRATSNVSTFIAPEKAPQVAVKGIVVQASNQTPVPFAYVSIYPLIDGKLGTEYRQVADDKGAFIMHLPEAPAYKIVVRYVGMKEATITISHTKSEAEINALKIPLEEEDSKLTEVVVTQMRKLVKVDIDKLSYSVADDPSRTGSKMLDILRKVPLVTVTGDDKIQVQGGTDFQVFLNGKPAPMFRQNPENVLKNMDASLVKKIEVITDPGVKYSAEGMSAILNIVTEMETERVSGYNANVYFNATAPQPGIGSGFTLSASKGKWGLDLSFFGNGDRNTKDYSEFVAEKKNYRQEVLSHSKNHYGYANTGASLSYQMTKKDLFTLSANFEASPSRTKARDEITEIINSREQRTISLHNDKSLRIGSDFAADYQHDFNTEGQMLILSYQFSNSPNKIKSEYFDANNAFESEIFSTKKALEHTAQADLTLPFNKKHILETGLKYIHRDNQSSDKEELKDPDYQQLYDIMAVYLSYSLKLGSWQMKVGGRLEKSRVEANQMRQGDHFAKWLKADFVPSISIAKQFANTALFKVNYVNSIKRPSISQLTPFLFQWGKTLLKRGNPNLRPNRNHRLNLSYQDYGHNLNYSIHAAYLLNTNIIEESIQQYYQDGQLMSLSSYENIGRSQATFLSLYLSYRGVNWMRLHANITGGTYFFNIKRPIDLGKRTTFMINLSGGAQFYLPRNFVWEMNGYYAEDNRKPLLETGNYWGGDFKLSKSFLKRQLNLSLNVSNPFRKYEVYRDKTWEKNPDKISLSNYSYAPSVTFSISYSFGNFQDGGSKKVSKSIQNDDLSSGGN